MESVEREGSGSPQAVFEFASFDHISFDVMPSNMKTEMWNGRIPVDRGCSKDVMALYRSYGALYGHTGYR